MPVPTSTGCARRPTRSTTAAWAGCWTGPEGSVRGQDQAAVLVAELLVPADQALAVGQLVSQRRAAVGTGLLVVEFDDHVGIAIVAGGGELAERHACLLVAGACVAYPSAMKHATGPREEPVAAVLRCGASLGCPVHPGRLGAMTTQFTLSGRARALTSSAIREILKVTERPEVISFAGGLPSPATFPVERMREATEKVLRDSPHAALQYGPTEGFTPLREWIAERLSRNGAKIPASRVLITTGSQQGLDLLGKVLIDEGSKVLVETPSYLGALQAFSLFAPAFASLPSDAQGIVTDQISPADLE